MSEYTYGNLLLAKDAELCKKYLDPGSYLIRLNDKWICRLNEKDKYFMNEIEKRPISANVLELSRHTPILFFANPADHGFGFAILEDGKTSSSIYLDYEGHSDFFIQEEGQAMSAESASYLKSVRMSFNGERFLQFGYTDEQVAALKELLTPETIFHQPWNVAERFKEILWLQKMSFILWDYFNDDEDDMSKEYPILAKG